MNTTTDIEVSPETKWNETELCSCDEDSGLCKEDPYALAQVMNTSGINMTRDLHIYDNIDFDSDG